MEDLRDRRPFSPSSGNESASDNGITTVTCSVQGNRFAAEMPRLRVPYHPGSGPVGLPDAWNVMLDCKRVVFVRPDDDGGARRMMFLLHFGDELRRRVAPEENFTH